MADCFVSSARRLRDTAIKQELQNSCLEKLSFATRAVLEQVKSDAERASALHCSIAHGSLKAAKVHSILRSRLQTVRHRADRL